MDSSTQPCTVCGGTDLNLVDGYYYCTECGTQDATLRETVIEYATRNDGTLAFHTQSRKILDEKARRDLDPEWYKWHAFNLMLAGWGEELEALGAGAGCRLRLLWLWCRYIRKHRKPQPNRNKEFEKSKESIFNLDVSDTEEVQQAETKAGGFKTYKINKLIMPVMQGMLYAALNASNSDIQVGDLRRFIKEERVSCSNYLKFIPIDFSMHKLDPSDRSLLETAAQISDTHTLRGYTMTLFRELELGRPQSPDLFKLVSRYLDELELPKDFRELVFSLMNFIPISLDVDFLFGIPRTPDYEGVAMAYIVIACKICFGLDGTCENELSDIIETFNVNNNCKKVYKFDIFNEHSDRLFSFREWMIHTEFKKVIVSKYYFPVALHNNREIDSQVFLSHTKDRARKIHFTNDVSEKVMMEILDRLNADIDTFNSAKIEFPPSLTPMKTYTEIILTKMNDPFLHELLGEDFSQYSLEYVTNDLKISDTPLSGVLMDNFNITDETLTRVFNFELDTNVVYVRNCDNDNWLTTKPPTIEHIKISKEEGYISDEANFRIARSDSTESKESNESSVDVDEVASQEKELLLQSNSDNIFNDSFKIERKDLWGRYFKSAAEDLKDFESNIMEATNVNYDIFNEDIQDNASETTPVFDRETAIEMIYEAERKVHGAGLERKPRTISKRTSVERESFIAYTEPRPKIPRNQPKRGEAKKEVESILEEYFRTLKNRSEYAINIEPDYASVTNDVAQPANIGNIMSEINQFGANLEDIQAEELVIEAVNSDEIDEVEGGNVREENQKFNPTKYDASQLYLRVANDTSHVPQDTSDDNELINLFCQLEQRQDKENDDDKISDQAKSKNDDKEINDQKDGYESDDIPISVLLNELKRTEKIKMNFAKVRNKDTYKQHNYWMLHYAYVSEGFDKDLDQKFSRTFAWLLRLCASVIESPVRNLYKQVINLESELKRAINRKYSRR